jgi:DNA-binding NtrC family response regulator
LKTANILVVDDDKNFLRVLTYYIQDFGFGAVPAPSGHEALKLLKEQAFDLLITDLKMPEMDGLELLAAVRRSNPDLPVIVLTAHGSIETAVEAIKLGAYDFLAKPFEKEEMRHAIANALKMADLMEENRRLAREVERKFQFEDLIGSSKKFRDVLELAAQLSGVDTTVLILGESGTGKELLAKAIHFNSRRARKPFVVVNCGAIPKDLVESELFGYKKGAFTGAVSNKKGKFEVADGGTVLLDEVGDLPLTTQVKLLRVLQEKQIDIVGDPHPHPVDIRILAATNRNLQQLIEDGHFRDDLYYRLSVAPVLLPPLRERREDIPLLIHHFLEKFGRKMDKHIEFENSAIEVLQAYDWPGNIRELENIIERSLVFDRSGLVTEADLPARVRQSAGRTLGKIRLELPEAEFSLEELERDILIASLEKHDWNQTHAARYLGMTRNTLIYRMQKYGIKEGGKRSEPSHE